MTDPGDRARTVLRRVGPVVLVVVVVLVSLGLFDALTGDEDTPGTAGVTGVYATVEADESWLGYLPADRAIPGLVVTGLTTMENDGPVARRVDVRVPGVPDGAVSLCFVGFDGDLASACPEAAPLGKVSRAVGLPFIGLVGPIGALDWLGVYSSPTPELADLDYLRR
ncbi:hypothetical protein [Nocardioides sp.]|uniref:hypothetical protein n=1 Tax=Nocardioides sp. TaxID=35761 RepID=UPI002B268E63|nr:hypothetical protein [Nocardioides sp.]